MLIALQKNNNITFFWTREEKIALINSYDKPNVLWLEAEAPSTNVLLLVVFCEDCLLTIYVRVNPHPLENV